MMSIIQCPECTSNISDQAQSCPHCGYPIAEYVREKTYNKEVERLTKKILPRTEFVCPENTRAKVCIKCCRPFSHLLKPKCNCGMPGVEVDYPAQQITIIDFRSDLYIMQNETIPRNIGDESSTEYKKYISILEKHSDESPRNPEKKYMKEQSEFEKELLTFSHNMSDANKPTCPICKSTDLKKITNTKKAAKISVFGLFGAGDIGKTWKCNNCGSRF